MGNLPMKFLASILAIGTLAGCGGTVAATKPAPETCSTLTSSLCGKNPTCLETTDYANSKNLSNAGCFQKCEPGSTDSCGVLHECVELRPPPSRGEQCECITTAWVCLPKP
jgi:hypothetical protein